jgi:SAM-dependent methyltransferase
LSADNQLIAHQWDANARARALQIESGKDLSRDQVIVPAMIDALTTSRHERLLDIGAGDGEFIGRLRKRSVARSYVGIDISGEMVRLARSRFAKQSTNFLVLEAEQAADFFGPASFDVVTANMVFNTAPRLRAICESVSRVLVEDGLFLSSLMHPAFFHLLPPLASRLPKDFDCSRESNFKLPFTISLDPRPLPSEITYFHRPVSAYLRTLSEEGFVLEDFFEPLPPPNLDRAYLANWRWPRFLIFRARRASMSGK